MKIFNVITLISLFLISSLVVNAQVEYIAAKDLKAFMKENPEAVLVDANKTKNYNVNHVKGAIHINHMNLYKEGDVKGLIKSPEDLAAFFGAKGISETTPVVIYDDGSQKYNTRIYWILKYIGAQNVKLMHKDLDEWRAARIPLTAAPSKKKAVTFTPTVDESILATIDDVKEGLANKPNFVLVDCRTADEYAGISKSEGHIPGAININYEDLLTETGAFKSKEELKAIGEKHGITADTDAVFYCKTSVRAASEFVAFKEILGYKNIRVYDGAYNEWKVENPLEQ